MTSNTEANVNTPGAAAIDFEEFVKLPRAEIFCKLLWACEGNIAEATILYETIRTCDAVGLGQVVKRSAAEIVEKFHLPANQETVRRSINELGDRFIVHEKVIRNMPREFVLDWVALSKAIAGLSTRLPGVMGGMHWRKL